MKNTIKASKSAMNGLKVFNFYHAEHLKEVNLQNISINIVHRPWGFMEVVFVNKDSYSLRVLNILPNQRLSFQKHALRDELFMILDNNLKIEIKEKKTSVTKIVRIKKGGYILVPRGVYHRFSSNKKTARCIEVSMGRYLQKDITRIEDDYGRPSVGE